MLIYYTSRLIELDSNFIRLHRNCKLKVSTYWLNQNYYLVIWTSLFTLNFIVFVFFRSKLLDEKFNKTNPLSPVLSGRVSITYPRFPYHHFSRFSPYTSRTNRLSALTFFTLDFHEAAVEYSSVFIPTRRKHIRCRISNTSLGPTLRIRSQNNYCEINKIKKTTWTRARTIHVRNTRVRF